MWDKGLVINHYFTIVPVVHCVCWCVSVCDFVVDVCVRLKFTVKERELTCKLSPRLALESTGNIHCLETHTAPSVSE